VWVFTNTHTTTYTNTHTTTYTDTHLHKYSHNYLHKYSHNYLHRYSILSGTTLMYTNMLILQREIDEVCARYKTVFKDLKIYGIQKVSLVLQPSMCANLPLIDSIHHIHTFESLLIWINFRLAEHFHNHLLGLVVVINFRPAEHFQNHLLGLVVVINFISSVYINFVFINLNNNFTDNTPANDSESARLI
jgi:hypothetical protein